MFAPVNSVGRRTTAEIEIGGKKIPAGTNFSFMLHGVHRNGNVWSDPAVFNPENFSPSNPNASAFVPFSLGPRNCIGHQFAMIEAKVVLSKLYKRYTFELVKPDSVHAMTGMISKPFGGLPVKIHRRKI